MFVQRILGYSRQTPLCDSLQVVSLSIRHSLARFSWSAVRHRLVPWFRAGSPIARGPERGASTLVVRLVACKSGAPEHAVDSWSTHALKPGIMCVCDPFTAPAEFGGSRLSARFRSGADHAEIHGAGKKAVPESPFCWMSKGASEFQTHI